MSWLIDANGSRGDAPWLDVRERRVISPRARSNEVRGWYGKTGDRGWEPKDGGRGVCIEEGAAAVLGGGKGIEVGGVEVSGEDSPAMADVDTFWD